MQSPRIVYTVRGAGLSVLVAAIVFVLTWQPLAFALIGLGALAGLAAGTLAERRGMVAAQPAAVGPEQERRSPLARVLQHERLIVRTAGLMAVAALLFMAAWYAGYYLLPEGILRGRTAMAPAGSGVAPSVLREWLGMALWNVTVPLALIVAGNVLLRINGYPLGYLPPLFNVVMYGLIIGTNSYTIPMPTRMAPSLAVLGRAGPYEFAGYLLVAAATSTLSCWEIRRFMRSNPERVAERPALSRGQWLAVGAGIAVILLAAWREAAMIVAAR